MSVRAKTGARRCQVCRLHLGLCLCPSLPHIETATRVVVVIHQAEYFKTTNTGRLAAACLANGSTAVHGRLTGVAQEPPAADGEPTLVLYPHTEARPIDALPAHDRPVRLLVPDGTWRQAAKIAQRLASRGPVTFVCLPPGAPSRYRLRTHPQPGGLATMEAIARALGILESQAVRVDMERIFRTMVDRLLWIRGLLPAAEVFGGIPPGVFRHDPASRPDAG